MTNYPSKIPHCSGCGVEMVFGKSIGYYADVYICPGECVGEKSRLFINDNSPNINIVPYKE